MNFKKGGSSTTGSIKKCGGGGGRGCRSWAAWLAKKKLLSILKGLRITFMGSLQISTGSTLGKVVHAVSLWPWISLTHRKSACLHTKLCLCRLTEYIVPGAHEPYEFMGS